MLLLSAFSDMACMRGARRLGVAQDSSFEEVQDARNYLYEVRKCSSCMLRNLS